ncbi:hypothetical protein BaRGS_00040439 [Batillaria attramentaria]|uniref:Vezatin n=1 Tax=Batillaria attramentaria TaxID=370345 RepID=A0ABD0J119_9CAEN
MADEADDNEDYDVIYANSPLYWSLVDAGLDGVGSQDVCKREESELYAVQRPLSAVEQSADRKKTIWDLSSWIWRGLLFFNHSEHDEAVVMGLKKGTFDTLSSSDLLNEEDTSFLCSLQENQTWDETAHHPLSTRKLVLSLLLAVTCAIMSVTTCIRGMDSWVVTAANTLTVIFVTVFVCQVTAVAIQRRASHRREEFLACVKDFLKTASKSMESVSRSIRFIQESELIARGFTFVGNLNTTRILNEMQYPDVVQLEVSDSEALSRLYEMTDGFTVDILKSIHELNRIHVSEFIRRLAVCFLKEGKMPKLDPVQELLQTVAQELDEGHRELQKHLDAHRHSSVSPAMRDAKTVTWQPLGAASQLQQTYLAVHSLELHLLAALKKIQDMGKVMEGKMEQEKSAPNQEGDETTTQEEIEETQRESWTSMLQMVRAELKASTGCLDEGVRHLEKKTTKEGLSADLKMPEVQAAQKANGSRVLKICAEDDPIIQDEVFEGYSEPQESGGRGDLSDITTAEEQAWRKKRKRDLKMCLTELGAIIAVRAADRQERERIAMERRKKTTDDAQVCGAQSGDKNGGTEKESDMDKVSSSDERDGLPCGDDCSSDDNEIHTVSGACLGKKGVTDVLDACENSSKSCQQSVHCEVEAAKALDTQTFGAADSRSLLHEKEKKFEESNQVDSKLSEHNLQTDLAKEAVHQTRDQQEMFSTVNTGVDSLPSASQQMLLLHEKTTENEGDGPCAETAAGDNQGEFSEDDPDSDSDVRRPGSKYSSQYPRYRSEPESVEEHLSLPAAPSPFAFSVASMVASRARNLTQTVDTFGDSSSDAEEGEASQKTRDEDENQS